MKSLRRFVVAIVVLGLGGVYAAAGLYEVAPDEEAAVLRLGRYHRTVGPGLQWRPLLIDVVDKRRVTATLEEEFGFRTVTPGPAPAYEERPEEKGMLTGDANVVNVEFVVQYRIQNLAHYLYQVDEPTETIRDVAQSAVREVVAEHPIDAVLTELKGQIEREAEVLIQKILDSYEAGIEIQNVQLQDVEPPDAVKDAFAEVASARQDRERLILEAQGYADQVVPQARGEAKEILNQAEAYRQTRILEAEGKTARFEALLEEYRKAPAVTRERLYLETLEVVLPRVDKVILEQEQAGNLLPYLPLPRRERGE